MTSSNSNYVPKAPSPNTITLERSFSIYEYWEIQTESPYFVESKIVRLIEVEGRMVVVRGLKEAELGEMLITGYKVSITFYNFYCNEN